MGAESRGSVPAWLPSGAGTSTPTTSAKLSTVCDLGTLAARRSPGRYGGISCRVQIGSKLSHRPGYRTCMPRSFWRVAPTTLLVGDTCALMNDVVQGARNGRLTSLIVALDSDTYRLFIPRHILMEIERNLPGYAAGRGVDAGEALRRWRRYYLIYARIVDVPAAWGAAHAQVGEVLRRHPVDAPTARLAAALARCCVLTEDGDLTDYGFGSKKWLPLAHAGANHAEVDIAVTSVGMPSALAGMAIWETGRALARASRGVQFAALLVTAAAAYWWQKDGRAERHLQQLKMTSRKAWDVVSPIAFELLAMYSSAIQIQDQFTVQSADTTALSERIARVLALGPDDGMLAREVADAVGMTESPQYAATKIRAVLRSNAAFVEISRGRWQLGHRMTTEPPPLPHNEQQEWMARAFDYLRRAVVARTAGNNEGVSDARASENLA